MVGYRGERKAPFFAFSKKDLLRDFTPLARRQYRRGKIIIKKEKRVDWGARVI